MPGFATSSRTLEQARRLMEAIGCERTRSTSAELPADAA
jgi:hypothetical protein